MKLTRSSCSSWVRTSWRSLVGRAARFRSAHGTGTRIEAADAHDLVDVPTRVLKLAARAGADTTQLPFVLPGGAEVTIRRADRRDLAAVLAMYSRCSALTLRRRYHGGRQEWPSRQLESLLATRFAYTLVAEFPGGKVAAMGNLVLDGQLAEVALLVEDDWQGQRLGTILTRRLLSFAADAGIDEVYALTQPDNTAMIRLMQQSGLRVHQACENGALTLTGHLR